MFRYNRLPGNTKDIQTLYNSALVRYNRGDSLGVADTLRNMAKTLNNEVNFNTLIPIEGTIEDVIEAFSNGKPKRTLGLLRHLYLELHYSRLVA